MIGRLKNQHSSPTVARSRPIAQWSAVLFAGSILITTVTGGCAKKYKRPPKPVALASAGEVVPTSQPVKEFGKFFAEIEPPTDWRYELTSESDRHEHVTWVSPGNNTAVGILYFKLPFPVGHDLAFKYGFLAEMRRKEGVAKVIEKHWDKEIDALRFTVESKFFNVEAKFFVRGMEGWAFYAGTRLNNRVNEEELETAKRVREKAEFVESKE
jgi:hypothetical protein